MTSEEKMREEFEAFYMSQDQNAKEHLEFIREDGEYGYHVTRCAWNAWKASRESLVIELPLKEKDMAWMGDYDSGCVYGRNAAIESCKYAIHAAGVKTK